MEKQLWNSLQFVKQAQSRKGKVRLRISPYFEKTCNVNDFLGKASLVGLDFIYDFSFICTKEFKMQVCGLRTQGVAVDPIDAGEIAPSDESPSTRKKRIDFVGRSVVILLMSTMIIVAMNGSTSKELLVNQQNTISHQDFFIEESMVQSVDQKIKIDEGFQTSPVIAQLEVDNKIALTFDDGPSKYTREIIEVLDDYNVKATFFLVGSNISGREDVVRLLHEKGHGIGNHTMTHPYLTLFDYEQQRVEITLTNESIENITGVAPTLFRPPYGVMDTTTERILREQQMKTILWNKDPKDWDTDDPIELTRKVLSTMESGSIVLFHEKEVTVAALPHILKHLLGSNMEFVKIH